MTWEIDPCDRGSAAEALAEYFGCDDSLDIRVECEIGESTKVFPVVAILPVNPKMLKVREGNIDPETIYVLATRRKNLATKPTPVNSDEAPVLQASIDVEIGFTGWIWGSTIISDPHGRESDGKHANLMRAARSLRSMRDLERVVIGPA